MNTAIICSKSTFNVWFPPASICSKLKVTEGNKSYGDWYLPSEDELVLMCQNKTTINSIAIANGGTAFASDYYWSSNQGGITWTAYAVSFGGSCSSITMDKDEEYYVRAIRAF